VEKRKMFLVIACLFIAAGTAGKALTDNSIYMVGVGIGMAILIGYFRPRSI